MKTTRYSEKQIMVILSQAEEGIPSPRTIYSAVGDLNEHRMRVNQSP